MRNFNPLLVFPPSLRKHKELSTPFMSADNIKYQEYIRGRRGFESFGGLINVHEHCECIK